MALSAAAAEPQDSVDLGDAYVLRTIQVIKARKQHLHKHSSLSASDVPCLNTIVGEGCWEFRPPPFEDEHALTASVQVSANESALEPTNVAGQGPLLADVPCKRFALSPAPDLDETPRSNYPEACAHAQCQNETQHLPPLFDSA